MSRILMVDDADLFRSLAATLFRRRQCEIVRARDTRDVLQRAGSIAPDLIVIDADRPGPSGVDCVRALKGDPVLRGTPVLVLATGAGATACSAAGADAALARPLSGAELEIALGRLGGLDWRRAPRRAARLRAQVEAGGRRLPGRVKDISRSGAFVAVRPAPGLDAEIRVLLNVPGPAGEAGFVARGRVVRRVEDDPDSHLIAGIGMRFLDLDEAAVARLDCYVGAAVAGRDAAGGAETR
jgi:CheY-like chemotaxis protein